MSYFLCLRINGSVGLSGETVCSDPTVHLRLEGLLELLPKPKNCLTLELPKHAVE